MKNTNQKQPTQSASVFGRLLLIASALLLTGSSTCAWASAQTLPDNAFQTVSGATTDSSIQGPVQSLAYSITTISTTTLPSIVIQEQSVGALRAVAGGNLISLVIDDWLQFDPEVVPTVTVSRTNGTILSGRISLPESSHFGSVENGRPNEKRTFDIRLLIASDATTGPYTITISGLRITTIITSSHQGSPIGDYSLTVIGNSNRQPGETLSTADLADGSNVGAKPTQQTLPVASVGCVLPPLLGTVTVEGPLTTQKITARFSPPNDVQGKQGSVFILGYIPGSVTLAPNTFWMFDANRNWHLFNSCETAVAYHSGDLTALNNIPLVAEPTDITALIGTQLYFGYGVSDSPLSVKAACNDMIEKAMYGLIYTAQ